MPVQICSEISGGTLLQPVDRKRRLLRQSSFWWKALWSGETAAL
ncbi:MAG: hypothetical protein PUB08_03520 [Firmicutes bacterium]|nr:hypothetical protein [Bacillota bacterium]